MSAQRELLFAAGSQPVETSEDAADSLSAEWLSARRRAVLSFFASRGETGATADELARIWKIGHNSVAPRITELVGVGLLACCDGKPGHPVRRKWTTRSGRAAFVHVITDKGRRFLR